MNILQQFHLDCTQAQISAEAKMQGVSWLGFFAIASSILTHRPMSAALMLL